MVHPLLFAVFPILFLLRENLWGLKRGEVLIPLVATIGAIGAIQFVGSRITGRPRKVGAVTSVIVILFFSYGHVWHVVSDGRGRIAGLDGDVIVGPTAIAVLTLCVIWIVRTRRSLKDLTRVANIISLAMVVSVALPLGANILGNRPTGALPAVPVAPVSATEATGSSPDIYYLVFDRYPGAKTLEELFGFDNHEFLEALADRGFQIAPGARANYQNTTFSLGASLNMRYLDWLGDASDGPADSRIPVHDAIKRSAVARFLKARGYRYIHIGNRWDMTRESPIADVNVRLDPTSEFTRVFLGSTALLPGVRRGVIGSGTTDSEELARKVTLRQFSEVAKPRPSAKPKFVFAHFSVPHPPYVFDRNGGAVYDAAHSGKYARARAYLGQLEFANAKILEAVDRLLDVPADRRPVIVLGSDEGPYPGFGPGYDPWWKASNGHLRNKFRILNAMHLPGAPSDLVPPKLSPVNTFRVIFNQYFGTTMPLLPDRSLVSRSKEDAYDWVDITARVAESRRPNRRPVRYPPPPDVPPHVRRAT